MSFVPVIILSCMVTVADASLYNFIYVGECVLGYNPVTKLLKHGCYCGFGNFGDNVTTEDGYDDCCKEHDKCYGNLVDESHECSNTLEEYFLPYVVGCPRECTATCYVPFPFNMIEKFDKCAMGLCRCDIKMMECWRRVQWTEKNGTRPDKRHCKHGEEVPTGVQEEGTWFEKLILYLEFKSNIPRTTYLNTNNIEDLPESKCAKYAGQLADINKIPHHRSNGNPPHVSSNEILPPSGVRDMYGNIDNNIIPYVY